MINSVILLIGLASAGDNHGHLVMNKNEYFNINTWNTTPDVVICKTQTVFGETSVREALSLWSEPYGNIYTRDRCNYEIERGVIKIIDDRQINTRNNWAETDYTFYRQRTKRGQEYRVYTGAIVQLNKQVNNLDLLVHELGHAFGYSHYDKKVDVMNSIKDY